MAKSKDIGSAFDLVGKSYRLVIKNWQAFLVVNILGVLTAVLSLGNKWAPDETNRPFRGQFVGEKGFDLGAFLGVGLGLVLLIVTLGLFLYAMEIALQVKASASKTPSISELASDAKKYVFRLLGLGITGGLIIILGLLLLIVPGIIAIGRLAMAPYLMIDKDLSIGEAIKQSNRLGKDNIGKVWAAIGVFVLLSLGVRVIEGISDIGPLVAVFAAIGFSLILPLRYQQLKKL